MLKRFLLILLIGNLPVISQAQVNQVKAIFYEDSFDIGDYYSDQKAVNFSFKIMNKAAEPLQLNALESGSANISLDKKYFVLKTGEIGFISGSFSPKNKAGVFVGTITATFNQHYNKEFHIKAHITPAGIEKTIEFPENMGSIRYKNDFLNFGTIKMGSKVNKLFTLYNQSYEDIKFSSEYFSPKHITAEVKPRLIKSKSKALLNVEFDATKIRELGYHRYQIVLSSDDSLAQDLKFTVVATIVPAFPKVTKEQMANQPNLALETDEYDFGYLNQSDSVTHQFHLTNLGKEALIIKKVESDCQCIAIIDFKKNYESEEKGEISIRFNPLGLVGTQYKRFTIYSNDPKKPLKDILIKAYIRK